MWTTETLVLAELGPRDAETGSRRRDRTLLELIEVLGISPDRLGDRMELVGVLENLREEGIVEMTRSTDGSYSVSLTESGVERTADLRSEIGSTRITLVDERRQEMLLRDAADELDRPLVAVAASLTDDDGVYFAESSTDDRIVGRADERTRCRQSVEQTSDTGMGRALLLTGPGGVGKTTLAEMVLEDAAEFGFDVVQTRGHGGDGEPYRAIRDALAELGSPLARRADGDSAVDVDGFQAQQTGRFHEFTEHLTPNADEPPRLLFIDDLHRVDPGTIEYLESLLERLPQHRLLLLGSYRPTELPEDVSVVFEDAGADTGPVEVRILHIDPLDASATRTLVQQTVGDRGAPDTLVETIYERTGGNPLFVEETVNYLLETGQLDTEYDWYPEDISDLDVPAAVHATVDERVGALDPAVQELLRVAALVADRIPLSVLDRITDGSDLDLRSIVAILADANVFEWTGDDEVTFRSEVIQEALVSDLAETERSQYHRQIADSLEAVSAPGDESTGKRSALIARHHERAGDATTAIEWYRRAGEHAMDVYAQDAAVANFERAIRLAREVDEETVLALTEKLAEVYFYGADFDAAERHSRFVRERASEPAQRQRAFALAAGIANNRGKSEEALALTEQGLTIDSCDDHARCTLLLQRASAKDHLGEFEAAIDATEQVLALVNDTSAPDLVIEGAARLGEIATKQDRLTAAEDHLERALDLAEELDFRHRSARIRLVLGGIAHRRSDLTTLHDLLQRAIEEFEAVGDPHGAAQARGNLGSVVRRRGDQETAVETLEQAAETLEALGDHHSAARNRGNLGSVALSQGNLDEAREYYQEALAVFEDVGERREVAMARTRLGEISLKQGAIESARGYLQPALDEFRSIDKRGGAAEAQLGLGIADIEDGEYASARERLERAHEVLTDIGDDATLTNVRLALAYLDTVAVSPERGLERWSAIAEHIDALDPSYSVEPFERLVQACRSGGHRAEAREWCERTLSELGESETDRLDRLRTYLVEQQTELEPATENVRLRET